MDAALSQQVVDRAMAICEYAMQSISARLQVSICPAYQPDILYAV